MAAVTEIKLVNITINDQEIQVPQGELIVESVKRLGLEIPIFCYHPRMKPVGMCRMCLVEVGTKQPDGSVRKMPKPQAGCTLPASEGLVIYTDTEAIHRDRKGVLEFLLINHPLDCPICDRGGECPLQNNTLFYGPSTSRYIEVKRHAPKAYPLSKYVTLDLERCIQCGRCVRFTEEISGDADLAFRFRGADMQPSTFKLLDFESKFSGNVIEICPVGALTSSQYRFRARPWDLETKPAVCTLCSNGCNIWFDHRANKLVRINGRTNEAVNEEWTCDKGKFGHEFYNESERLTQPLIRKDGKLSPCSWGEAYEAIAAAFKAGGSKVAGLVAGTASNEGLFLFRQLFAETFKSHNLDHRWTKHQLARADRPEFSRGVPSVQTSIESLESKPGILVFGSSLADELPIVFLRVRKAKVKHGAKIVTLNSGPADTDRFADVVLQYQKGSELMAALGLLKAAWGEVGESWEKIERITGLREADFAKAVNALPDGSAVLTSHALLNTMDGADALIRMVDVSKTKSFEFSAYPLNAEDAGATMLGVLPDCGPNLSEISPSGLSTDAILNGCARGDVHSLWVIGGDPFRRHTDPGLVMRAIESVDFLVVQGSMNSDIIGYASVVLPQSLPAEMDGTYTNCEGRVQRMKQVLTSPGEAKQDWRIFMEARVRLSDAPPYFSGDDVRRAISASVPGFEIHDQKALMPGKSTTESELVEMN